LTAHPSNSEEMATELVAIVFIKVTGDFMCDLLTLARNTSDSIVVSASSLPLSCYCGVVSPQLLAYLSI
jgi:hypothetical protein